MIEVNLTTEQRARIRVVPKTAGGQPAQIQSGSLVVTAAEGLVNPVIDIESDDTFTCQADLPDGVLNVDADFEVSGDADLGEGVETISDVVRCHVTTAKAANLGLTAVEVIPRA